MFLYWVLGVLMVLFCRGVLERSVGEVWEKSVGEKCCREVLEESLVEECGEKRCREALENSVVEKCWRRVLCKSVGEKCCRGVVWRSVVEKCWGEVL